MILDSLDITATEFEVGTGWAIQPEGACRDGRCVPLPETAGGFDLRVVARRLGMPLVHDVGAGVWALGPESGGRALNSAVAPELVLRDWRDREFRLSSLRGKKALLVAWASW